MSGDIPRGRLHCKVKIKFRVRSLLDASDIAAGKQTQLRMAVSHIAIELEPMSELNGASAVTAEPESTSTRTAKRTSKQVCDIPGAASTHVLAIVHNIDSARLYVQLV